VVVTCEDRKSISAQIISQSMASPLFNLHHPSYQIFSKWIFPIFLFTYNWWATQVSVVRASSSRSHII
jgi:hypothetical protein